MNKEKVEAIYEASWKIVREKDCDDPQESATFISNAISAALEGLNDEKKERLVSILMGLVKANLECEMLQEKLKRLSKKVDGAVDELKKL